MRSMVVMSSLVIISLAVSCGKKKDKSEDSAAELESNVPAGGGSATSGTVYLSAISANDWAPADQPASFALASLKMAVTKVELSKDGINWVSAYGNSEGAVVDLGSGDGTISIPSVVPGTYEYAYVEVKNASTYKRTSSACSDQTISFAADSAPYAAVFATGAAAATLQQNFAFPGFAPGVSPASMKSSATEANFLQLSESIVVSAGQVTELFVTLAPTSGTYGSACNVAPSKIRVAMGSKSSLLSAMPALKAEYAPYADLLAGKIFKTACIAEDIGGGDFEYSKITASFERSGDGAAFNYVNERQIFMDAACTPGNVQYKFKFTYDQWAVGTEIDLATRPGVRSFDTSIYEVFVTPVDAGFASDLASGSMCGYSDWVAGSGKSLLGRTCGGGEPFPVRGAKSYSVIKFGENSLQIEGSFEDGTNDGKTAAKRNTVLDSQVLSLMP